jgi:hypothetical protein
MIAGGYLFAKYTTSYPFTGNGMKEEIRPHAIMIKGPLKNKNDDYDSVYPLQR